MNTASNVNSQLRTDVITIGTDKILIYLSPAVHDMYVLSSEKITVSVAQNIEYQTLVTPCTKNADDQNIELKHNDVFQKSIWRTMIRRIPRTLSFGCENSLNKSYVITMSINTEV